MASTYPSVVRSIAAANASTSGAPTPSQTKRPDRLYRLWQKQMYPKELWWFVGGIIGVLSVYHFIVLLALWRHRRHLVTRNSPPPPPPSHAEKPGGEVTQPGKTGKVSFRRLPSSIVTAFRIVMFRWTLPFRKLHRMNITEMFFTLAYLAALLTWSFIFSHNLEPIYWANRTGHLATSQIPLIVGLAGKNNVISFLTGIGPEKLNFLHRASARSCLILIWVHAFGRWKLGFVGSTSLEHPEIQYGIVSMAAFSLAFFMSLRPLRNIAYETFLVCHVVLVFLFILFAYLHKPEESGFRIWPGFLLWGLDRATRILRLVVLSRLWVNLTTRDVNRLTVVSGEKVSSDTVRLTMTLRSPISFKAGQHVYLMVPSVSRFPLEAHPFTPASISGSNDDGATDGGKQLIFIIRARDGFTRRMFEFVEKNGTKQIPAYVDGPYGYPPSRSLYNSTCVLIAGGSGVSYTLSLFKDIVFNARNNRSDVRRVLFIWVIRDPSHINWVSDAISAATSAAPPTLSVDVRIFVTQAQVTASSTMDGGGSGSITPTKSSEDEKKIDLISNSSLESMRTMHGRPNIPALLSEEIDIAQGPVSVDVSGPASLAQAVRNALSSDIAGPIGVLKGRPTVNLYIESFGW